jgi:hypothetical protein
MMDKTSEINNVKSMLFVFSHQTRKIGKWHCMPIIHQKSWFDHMKNFSLFLNHNVSPFFVSQGWQPLIVADSFHI